MPIPFLIPLALAAAGAMIDKEKPLRGALIGGTLGAGGAALGGASLLGGAAGSAGSAGAAGSGGLLAGGETAAMLAAQNAGIEGATALTNSALASNGAMYGAQAAAPIIEQGTQAGLYDMLNAKSSGLLDKGMGVAKNANTAMQTASMFKPKDKGMPQPSPMLQMPTGTGANSIAQVSENNRQKAIQNQQQEYQKREERRKLLMSGLLGGRYGRTA